MNYTIDTDLWDLRQRVSVLEVNSDKHNARLNKLEDVRDDKVMPEEVEGVDFSHTIPGKGYETATVKINPDPSKLESNKDVALDWYINQYQNMCKEYNKVKIELDGKQKVLEQVMDQRDRYIKQLMNTEKKVKELAAANYDFNKSNQILRGKIKNHEDRILELEKEVEYHKAFAGSEKIKKLELDIKHLEDKNRFLSDLNDEYRKMVVNDENKNSSSDDMAKKIKELEDKVKYYEAMSPEQYKIQYMQLKDMGSEIYLRNKFQLENEELTEENLKLKKEIVKLKIAAKGQPNLVIKVTGE